MDSKVTTSVLFKETCIPCREERCVFLVYSLQEAIGL